MVVMVMAVVVIPPPVLVVEIMYSNDAKLNLILKIFYIFIISILGYLLLITSPLLLFSANMLEKTNTSISGHWLSENHSTKTLQQLTGGSVSIPLISNLRLLRPKIITHDVPSNFYSRFEDIPEEGEINDSNYQSFISNDIGIATNSCNIPDSNLGFESKDFRCWITNTTPSALSSDLIRVVPPFGNGVTGFDTHSTLFGDPNHNKDVSPLGANGAVALSHIYQATLTDHGNPQLHFDYLMYSHDVIHAVQNNKFLDWLEVGVIISGIMTPLKKYGNPRIDWDGHASTCRPTRWESNSGIIKHEILSLDEYRGQTIGIYFILYNKEDSLCNSWAFVDNVKIDPQMTISKVNDPVGSLHEGDLIRYTISYLP